MSYDTPIAPSLFDLLARTWTLPGAVTDACFNHDNTAVTFIGADQFAVAPLADPERPETRMRVAADTGRATILPRKTPVRPIARVGNVGSALASYGGKSFVAVGVKGGLVSVTPRGQAVPLAVPLGGPASALARDPASAAVAVASGSIVLILPDDREAPPQRIAAAGPVHALAFAPSGAGLAVAHDGGVSIWTDADLVATVALDGVITCLNWSPDGAFLACGFAAPGLALIRRVDSTVDRIDDYPTTVRSFGWNTAAAAFLTSGAFRIAGWTLALDGRGPPLETGRSGLVIVERIASCPDRPLVAAGYASGLVVVSRIGGRDEMLLRGDGAAVTALAWSPDGVHLAVGDADGAAALLSFPPNLFK